MQAKVAQYLNEIVSLSILALMSVALIAGQAAAHPQQDTVLEQISTVVLEDIPNVVIDIDFRIRHKGE